MNGLQSSSEPATANEDSEVIVNSFKTISTFIKNEAMSTVNHINMFTNKLMVVAQPMVHTGLLECVQAGYLRDE